MHLPGDESGVINKCGQSDMHATRCLIGGIAGLLTLIFASPNRCRGNLLHTINEGVVSHIFIHITTNMYCFWKKTYADLWTWSLINNEKVIQLNIDEYLNHGNGQLFIQNEMIPSQIV